MSFLKPLIPLLLPLLLSACATTATHQQQAVKTPRNPPAEANVGKTLVGAFMPY